MMGADAVQERYGSRTGERIGALVFERIAHQRYDGARLLGIFRCDCGSTTTLPLGRVLNGKRRVHCGCQTDHGASRTHGMRGSPEYSSWQAMKGRCLDPNNKDFPGWGARGVTVCDAWVASFEAFFEHVGARPAGTTLDRINTLEGYEPGNVRWATAAQQQANRRDAWIVQIGDEIYEGTEAAARACGVSAMTIIRWCEGYTDHRRRHQECAGRVSPRPNCRRWRKYAA